MNHFAHVQRPVGVRGIKYRSKAEANYAAYLNWLKYIGQVREWKYEPIEMWFTPNPPPVRKGRARPTAWSNPAHLGLSGVSKGHVTYRPDFSVDENKGYSYYVEVKGYMDARSKTVLARARRYFPGVRIDVVDSKQMAALKRQVGSVVPGWIP